MKRINVFICLVSLLLMLGLTPVSSNCDELQTTNEEEKICFSIEDSKKIVVELEKNKLYAKKIKLLEKTSNELTNQTNLLKDENIIVNDKFESCQSSLTETEKIYTQQVQVLNDELKEAKKPRWKSLFASMGLGSMLTLLLIIAL